MTLHPILARSARRWFAAAALAALTVHTPAAAFADTIAQWNFNVPTGANNTPAPSTGTGSATPIGMTNNANSADIVAATGTPASSDAGVPNNAWRVRGSVSNGWSGTTQLLSGAQFNASTVGQTDINVSMEIHATDGSPRYAQLQYTTDGSTFTSIGALLDFNTTFDGFAPFAWNLTGVPGVDNNANFGVKLVSAFSPVEFTNANGVQAANTAFQRASATTQVYNGTAGNWRFDMVTVAGTAVPEPASLAAAGAAVLAGALVRRRPRG
jgi:hypothetical protein